MSVSIALKFAGMDVLLRAFEDILASAVEEQKGDWYVASAASYAGILEWRSPHWIVAIQIIADEAAVDEALQQEYLNAMIAGGGLTKKMILRLKAEIRRQIRAHGLIDTGNYIGSIAIGPSAGEAFINSEDQLLDPTTSVLA